MKKLGLIVNPIAGMGGRVGLKGTDGDAALARARQLHAPQEAPARAVQALEVLASAAGDLRILTCPGGMGEDEARAAGFSPTVVVDLAAASTTARRHPHGRPRDGPARRRPPAIRGRRRHGPRYPRRNQATRQPRWASQPA